MIGASASSDSMEVVSPLPLNYLSKSFNSLTNGELKPSSTNFDLRAYKDFRFEDFRLSLFARVYNLFDIRKSVNVL